MARSRVPLNVLLSRCLVAFTRDYEADGGMPSLALWAGVLRAVDDVGVTMNDLRTHTRLSRRAVVTIVKGATSYGLVEVVDKMIIPTEAGRRARDAAQARVEATEAAWRQRFGGREVDALRAGLAGIVVQFELELPHYPIGYGAADDSIGRGNQDWRDVRREGPDSAVGLTLCALLSQALIGFALDYETHGAWSLAGASAIARIRDGMPLKAQPPGANIAGGGKSGLERHGIVEVEAGPTGAVIRLTDRGRHVQAAYKRLPGRIENEWGARYGPVVGEVRTALETIDANLPPGLPDHPLISWMGGIREVSTGG